MGEQVRTSIGLDLGSTRVAMAMIQQIGDGRPQVIGFAQHACRFLRGGIVINLEALASAVDDCVEQIESLTRTPIRDVTVNVPAGLFRTEIRTGNIEIRKKREITPADVEQVHREVSAGDSEEWVQVHLFPEEYLLDEQKGLTSPLGMSGRTLGVRLLEVSVPGHAYSNMTHTIAKCGLRIRSCALDTIAGTSALLTPDEIELGVWLVDIGGAYTQMAAIRGKTLTLLPVLPIGGDQVTSDIAIGLRTPIREAERIKIDHGCAVSALAARESPIEIALLGGGQKMKPISPHMLSEIIQPRMDEMLEITARTFRSAVSPDACAAGVIFTGGGSLLPGTSELAEKHFQMPVIAGHLREVTGLTDLVPESLSSTAIGLALLGLKPFGRSWSGAGRTNPLFTILKSLFNWLGGGTRQ